MPREALRFEDGTPVCERFYGKVYHYLASKKPVAALCGARWPFRGEGCRNRYTNGEPVPVCGNCRRIAGEKEPAR